ncbi:FMN-binding protein [Oceanobacillus halophilus]|uniref:FMN-binding protein n=1 Tax=Oceanobacillus halophilus TaxID=930130 RepID=A0A494ZWU5_9BACI|nr:FMN-binding protein [Oceanobacillus halophilus]RKQ30404.1 FMN-binding protein [Oceanobacillus halophilus]
MTKRWLVLVLAAMVSLFLITGCGTEGEASESDAANDIEETESNSEETSEETGSYEDGIYYAEEDGFGDSGWKYIAVLEVEDGKIVSADWNGAHKAGGDDKDTVSANGEYGMVENGDAQAEWHEQAELVEAYLIETQDPTAIEYTTDEGHTDAISGVSIHVVEFFDLAEKALANGPVEKGPYKDGAYYAEEDEFGDSGWKYTASLTVVNGNIVAADWNGVFEDGGDDKDTVSANGEYGMVENGGAQAEWHEQAELAEAYLLEVQDPTAIEYTSEEGHTDAISGVSIHVVEFFDLAEKALAEAK